MAGVAGVAAHIVVREIGATNTGEAASASTVEPNLAADKRWNRDVEQVWTSTAACAHRQVGGGWRMKLSPELSPCAHEERLGVWAQTFGCMLGGAISDCS